MVDDGDRPKGAIALTTTNRFAVPIDLPAHFAARMSQLGPFGPTPRFAVAVSGGADSTALAVLAQRWVNDQNATLRAFIIDHRLRSESAAEAHRAQQCLAALGIAADIIALRGLDPGSGLQDRARTARYQALTQAAHTYGAFFMLLGHHADDQTELIAMRAKRGPRGQHGMAPWSARNDLILLRPLLDVPHATLQHFLATRDIRWIEDPSNVNPAFERARLRQSGLTTQAANPTMIARHCAEAEATAQALAAYVTLRPEGFALIAADHIAPEALSGLIRVIGGANHPPPRAAVARVAPKLGPATLAGVQIAFSRRLDGFLLAREPAACAPPAPAEPGARWDHRFLLRTRPAAATYFGALGSAARDVRNRSMLPSRVLRGLPALFADQKLLAVPHLNIGAPCVIEFSPPHPATIDAGYAAWG